jgi:hypothetical protein
MAVVENTVYLKSEGHLQELNGTLPNLTRTNTHVGIPCRTYQQSAGVITKFSQHLNDNSCEDGKSK